MTEIYIRCHGILYYQKKMVNNKSNAQKRTMTTKQRNIHMGKLSQKINAFSRMDYTNILKNYREYPTDGQYFRTINGKVKFSTQQEIAEGWCQTYDTKKDNYLHLRTKLQYLPEDLWENLRPWMHKEKKHEFANNKEKEEYYNSQGIMIGYKVYCDSVRFFVDISDTDELCKRVFNYLHQQFISRAGLEDLVSEMDEFEELQDSWLYIRAMMFLENCDGMEVFKPKMVMRKFSSPVTFTEEETPKPKTTKQEPVQVENDDDEE